jgi:hypothetical protein
MSMKSEDWAPQTDSEWDTFYKKRQPITMEDENVGEWEDADDYLINAVAMVGVIMLVVLVLLKLTGVL